MLSNAAMLYSCHVDQGWWQCSGCSRLKTCLVADRSKKLELHEVLHFQDVKLPSFSVLQSALLGRLFLQGDYLGKKIMGRER